MPQWPSSRFFWEEGKDRSGIYADVTIPGAKAGFRMRFIEPGTFWMGSPEDETDRYDNEGPRHEVTLTKGFWMADAPCTQAVYEAVTGQNPSRFKDPDRPVEQVSWSHTLGFIRALNTRVSGAPFFLPSEAQWEYACRATTMAARYGELDGIAWYRGNAGGQTHPVRQKQPNAWGLYDMLGNVWEWCHDGRRTYEKSHAHDPLGPMHEGTERVLRGGSWNNFARHVRAASRLAYEPSFAFDFIGFRISRGQTAPSPARPDPEGQSARKQEGRRGGRRPREADPKPPPDVIISPAGPSPFSDEGHPVDRRRRALLMGGATAVVGVGLVTSGRFCAVTSGPTPAEPPEAAAGGLKSDDEWPGFEGAEKVDRDDDGVYADVMIPGSKAGFRMRFIRSGTFWMGSPEDEVGRYDREGPRHEVTLTKGFWLADVPCTQAVYQAVVGENPSRFKSDDRPVEQVSWHDAQSFLENLNQQFTGGRLSAAERSAVGICVPCGHGHCDVRG